MRSLARHSTGLLLLALAGCDRLLPFGPRADGRPGSADLRLDGSRLDGPQGPGFDRPPVPPPPVPVKGGGTSGGPLNGRLRVWTQTAAGVSVPGVWLRIATGAGPVTGVTDAEGFAELADPRLAGPITVTAGKATFITVTLEGLEASGLTVPMRSRIAPSTTPHAVGVGTLVPGECARASALASPYVDDIGAFLADLVLGGCYPQGPVPVLLPAEESSAFVTVMSAGTPVRLAVVEDVQSPGTLDWRPLTQSLTMSCSTVASSAVAGVELAPPLAGRMLATRLALTVTTAQSFAVPDLRTGERHWGACVWPSQALPGEKASTMRFIRGLSPGATLSPPTAIKGRTDLGQRLNYTLAPGTSVIRLALAPDGPGLPFWIVSRFLKPGAALDGKFSFVVPPEMEQLPAGVVVKVVAYSMPDLKLDPFNLRFYPTWQNELAGASWEGPWLP